VSQRFTQLTESIVALSKLLPAVILLTGSVSLLIKNIWPAEAADEKVQALLKSEFEQYPIPPPNVIALVDYKENCTIGEVVSTYSTYLSSNAFTPVRTRTISEPGWKQIYEGHAAGGVGNLAVSILPPDNPLRTFSAKTGVAQILSVAIDPRPNCPQGYVSVGYGELITGDRLRIASERLRITAQVIGAAKLLP
jgi:hypothetical protein